MNIRLNNKIEIDITTLSEGSIIKEWDNERGYVEVYKNLLKSDSSKAILYIHGGGFLYDSPRSPAYVSICKKLCKYTGYNVYCPDFVLPEIKRYPCQLSDILNVVKYIKKSYKKIILIGDSSGGCIAMSMLIKYTKMFEIGIFISPWLDLKCQTISYKTRAWCNKMKTGDPVFKMTPKKNREFFKKDAIKYLGNKKLLNDDIANPYYAKKSILKKIPPILILVGDNETIRNDSLDFALNCQSVNNNIFVKLYDKMWHNWVIYDEESIENHDKDAFNMIVKFCHGKNINDTYTFNNKHDRDSINVSIIL